MSHWHLSQYIIQPPNLYQANNEVKNFLRILVPGQEPNVEYGYSLFKRGQTVVLTKISIIAVHGLNPKNKENHAERTWESEGKLWLRDFLPKQLPRARILLYGYNSSVGFQSSAAGVREQAQNLLNGLWIQRKVLYYRKYLLFMVSNVLI